MRDLSTGLLDRWLKMAGTPRGWLVTAFATLVAISTLSGSPSPAGFLTAILFAFPLAWAAGWLFSSFLAWRWEQRTRPPTPRFARQPATAGSRTALREDGNAHFWQDRGGFLWRKRFWFSATGCPPTEFTEDEYGELAARRHLGPVHVVSAAVRDWWWWGERFYWTNEEYQPDDVMALVLQRERRKERQLQHAHALMATEEAPTARRREPIPEEVKRLIWRRDEGRCQTCGSSELLQYDHIIPVTMGGSHEPENLQLLCADCNRSKGGRL